MNLNKPKATDCYWRVIDVILSCRRQTHYKNTVNLINNFANMFPEETVRLRLLKRIYNNCSLGHRVKQIV